MKVGKISEAVLKRAILKQVKTIRKEVIVGPGVGEDCAILKLEPGESFVLSTDPITGTVEDIGELSIHVTANDLASTGAEPVGVMVTLLLPEDIFESDIKKIMVQIEEVCSKLNIQIIGGHTEITKAVNQPVISITGVGKVKDDNYILSSTMKPGEDVIVTKWIGMEGTAIIAKEKEEELLKRFARPFIETAKQFDQYLSIVDEAALAVKSGVSAMHDVTEGGIYGALWEMAEASGVGLEIDLLKIPIKQETIELCEVFDMNPYGLISSGSLLISTGNGHDMVRAFEKNGMKATVIGKVVKGNERLILNNDEKRFLEPPKSDEIYKLSE